MGTTPDLGIPEISESQSNAHLTHNYALGLLQAILNGVIDKDLTAPPGAPIEGDAYLLAGGSATGAWAGYLNHIAIYYNAAWRFIPGVNDAGTVIAMSARQEGLTVFVRDEGTRYIWTGSPLAWTLDASAPSLDFTAADKMRYGGGGGTATETDITAAARSLLDDASVSAMVTTLGLGGLAGGSASQALTKNSGTDFDFLWSSNVIVSSGTFTPTIQGSTTPGTQTYTVQSGYYFKIGSLVFVNIYVQMSAKDAATAGNVQIAGLPFTARNTASEFPLGNAIYRSVNLDNAGGFMSSYGLVLSNSTLIVLGQQGDNVVQKPIVAADIVATTGVFFSGWYVAA